MAVIPRSALLCCENSTIRDSVLEYKKLDGEDVSSWVPLLLALAAEYSNGVSVGEWDGEGVSSGCRVLQWSECGRVCPVAAECECCPTPTNEVRTQCEVYSTVAGKETLVTP